MSIQNKINEIKQSFGSDLDTLNIGKIDFQSIYYKFLGRKGLISELYPMLAKVDNSKKPQWGNDINNLKKYIEDTLSKFNPNTN